MIRYCVVTALLLVGSAATAQTAPAKPADKPAKPICRYEGTTGSIMPGKKVCHTKEEWAAISATNQSNNEAFRNRPNSMKPQGL